MEKHLLFVLTKPPYGSSSARESIDAMLATLAFGQQVSILALGDGVFQFIAQQNPEQIQQKNTGAMLSALPMYGADHFYATTQDLAERRLHSEDFAIPVIVINDEQMRGLFQQAHVVLSY